jgi:hypothetical protein
MKNLKALTFKKRLPLVIITNAQGITDYVIKREDGSFSVHDWTNYIKPGQLSEDQQHLFDFDENPFVEFLKEFKQKQADKLELAKKQAKEAEEKRIEDLKARIENCETPVELSKEFGINLIDTASHWSDLYEGRSSYGFLISNREDYEIMELAIEIHSPYGSFGEACKRNGAQHHTFSEIWGGLKGYQENIKSHFSGDKYFYKSQESDQEFYFEEIADAAANKDMEKVQALINSYNEIEAGYYDCNGNLEISDKDLDSADFTGYSEDVYSYSFCYNINQKYSWKEEVEEEIEED